MHLFYSQTWFRPDCIEEQMLQVNRGKIKCRHVNLKLSLLIIDLNMRKNIYCKFSGITHTLPEM